MIRIREGGGTLLVSGVSHFLHTLFYFLIPQEHQQPYNLTMYVNSSGYVTDLLVSKQISSSKQKIVLLH